MLKLIDVQFLYPVLMRLKRLSQTESLSLFLLDPFFLMYGLEDFPRITAEPIRTAICAAKTLQ